MEAHYMNNPRYLLAKYVPDLTRMEPRNVGVIVWAEGEIAARFMGEKPNRPGEVDGRKKPNFVSNVNAYKQWIEYWRLIASAPSFRLASGSEVPRESEKFVVALENASRGNFLLVASGEVLDSVEPSDLQALSESLFSTLVEREDDSRQDRDVDSERKTRTVIRAQVRRSLGEWGVSEDRIEAWAEIPGATSMHNQVDIALRNGDYRAMIHTLSFDVEDRGDLLMQRDHVAFTTRDIKAGKYRDNPMVVATTPPRPDLTDIYEETLAMLKNLGARPVPFDHLDQERDMLVANLH
jgi:hypothetical protein